MSVSKSSCSKADISKNEGCIKPEPKFKGKWYKVNHYTRIFVKKGQDPEEMIQRYRNADSRRSDKITE